MKIFDLRVPGTRQMATVEVQPRRKQVTFWTGYLADRATRTVVRDNGTSTKYGQDTTEDPAFYSDDSLAADMAEGRLLYEAVERLIAGTAADFDRYAL
jgi:hypothetical protein